MLWLVDTTKMSQNEWVEEDNAEIVEVDKCQQEVIFFNLGKLKFYSTLPFLVLRLKQKQV